MSSKKAARSVLWWGRFDPDYSRNRILRQQFQALGWTVRDFQPKVSRLGYLEATLGGVGTGDQKPDLVWVPCFRQRDMPAALGWARRQGIRIVFDPLISAYDKQIFEKNKFPEGSADARRLLEWECDLFGQADLLVADTEQHRDFFTATLGARPERVTVVPVGAEEPLFSPVPVTPPAKRPIRVLFYGSFISLQGPTVIVEAARAYPGCGGPPVEWCLVGEGPLLAPCRQRAEGLGNVRFEPWVPYADLPARIHSADILLGVFGPGPKAGRVIPNKVYQALAAGRPVITRESPAYPPELVAGMDEAGSGVAFIPPGDPEALARAVAGWAGRADALPARGEAARAAYERFFGNDMVRARLAETLERALSA
ncbi:MAG: glycosyltransferase [Nitrospirota bacterium]|nr:glycosyltransferase [Nitrospirota bacterium]